MRPAVLILFLILTVPTCAAFAEQKEISVEVRAENLKFFEDSGQMIASGAVEVKLKEAVIFADRLWLDSSTNLATAEGNVKLILKDYQAQSEKLAYDTDREISRFSDFQTKLYPGTLRGPLFVKAGEMSDEKISMKGKRGNLTTCDYDAPHYFVLAERVEYYPDDRIEAANATMYVGEAPVLWLPYARYDLKRRQRNWEIGHNEVEGDFIKSSWAVPAGLLLLDYMTKKGIGYGLQRDYGLDKIGAGSLYLYHLDEKDTRISDWIERIEHRKQFTSATSLKFNHSYIATYRIPSGRIDQTGIGVELNHTAANRWNLNLDSLDDRIGSYQRYGLQLGQSSGKEALNYYYSYEFLKTAPRWLRKTQRLNYRTPFFTDRINFSTGANYYHSVAREGESGEERIEPQIEFSGAERDFSWRVSRNWFLDLRQSLYPGGTRYEFMEKQPEVEITPRALNLTLFDLQSSFGYGRYREVRRVPELGGNRDYTAERSRAALNAGKSVPLTPFTVLLLGAGVDQFAYSPGDQLYAFRESASLQTDNRKFFKNNLDFRQGYTDGNTPFLFDQLGARYHDITEKMTFYYLDKFNWSVESGHNWQTNKWFDLLTRLMLSPDPRLRWTLDTGWDIENRRYRDLVSALKLSPYSYLGIDLALTRDMNTGDLRAASALYDIYFLEKEPNQLRLRLSQVYDPVARDFKVRDIMIVKDLHCWEMKYSYSDYRKEFSLIFTLKALPQEPLGFSTGRGFYFDTLERELRQFQPANEVRRY